MNNPINAIDPWGLRNLGDFKYYGNWGGPGWTAGRWTSWDNMSQQEKKEAQDPNSANAPVDKQDNCYMQHDICYGDTRDRCKDVPCPEKCKKKGFNKCDKQLSGCLVGCGMTPGAVNELRRLIAIPTFQLQPAFRNGGPSQNSDGPNKEYRHYQLRFEF